MKFVAAAILVIGVQSVAAARVEIRCAPTIVPEVRCDPGSLKYNPGPLECRRT